MRVNSRDNCNLPGGNRAPAALALSGMAVIASADANTTAADARAARRHCRVMRRAGFELVANEIGLPVPPLAMLWTRGVVYAIAVRHPTLRALSAFGRAVASLCEVDRVRSQLRHDREGGLPPARPDKLGTGGRLWASGREARGRSRSEH